MTLTAARFKLDEEISLAGKPMRVAGLVQYEAAGAATLTRYLLAGASGAPQILEETTAGIALLRPFPATALPQASGDTVNVMGAEYKLAEVRKLKVLGAAGEAPGGAPAGPLVLSGVFKGAMGMLVREIAPGSKTQSFYSVKAVHPDDALGAEQVAAQAEQARLAEAQQAEDDDEKEEAAPGGIVRKALSWVIAIAVMVGLGFACSDSDDGSGGSGSARTSVSHSRSGGK